MTLTDALFSPLPPKIEVDSWSSYPYFLGYWHLYTPPIFSSLVL